MASEEIFYAVALTRMTGFNQSTALYLYQEVGSATAVYEHRMDIGDVMPSATPRLREAMKDWDEALHRAAAEMEFIEKNGIRALTLQDADYPQRLSGCPDAPILLYYKGEADLNQQHIINIVGTRHCTNYGQDLVRHFVSDLRELCPDVLIVSGLAYGIDICAHRQALACGYETVGVLAHGLDQLYPPPSPRHGSRDGQKGWAADGVYVADAGTAQQFPTAQPHRGRHIGCHHLGGECLQGWRTYYVSHRTGVRARRAGLPRCRRNALLGGVQQDDSQQHGSPHHIGSGLYGVSGVAYGAAEARGHQPTAIPRTDGRRTAGGQPVAADQRPATKPYQRKNEYSHWTTDSPALLAGDEGGGEAAGRWHVPSTKLTNKRYETH